MLKQSPPNRKIMIPGDCFALWRTLTRNDTIILDNLFSNAVVRRAWVGACFRVGITI